MQEVEEESEGDVDSCSQPHSECLMGDSSKKPRIWNREEAGGRGQEKQQSWTEIHRKGVKGKGLRRQNEGLDDRLLERERA